MISLVAVGDVMLGDHPVCFGHGVRSTIDKIGIDEYLDAFKRSFGTADIVTGNVEAGLSNEGLVAGRLESEEMRGRPDFAAGLARAGFNVMTVANNHALHHGHNAFSGTCDLLRQNKIGVIGLPDSNGSPNSWQFEKNGIRIAVVGYSCRPEKYQPDLRSYARGDDDALVREVARLRSEGNQVVVNIHWGEEYLQVPSPYQIRLGRMLADAGACLIVGHHPHVLQGYEKYENCWIFYSLGNFSFDHWDRMARESMVVQCSISAKGVEQAKTVPLWIGNGWKPEIARGAIAERISRTIDSLASRVGEFAGADYETLSGKYQQLADKAYFHYRLDSYRYFLTRLWKYQPSIIGQSFARALRRRAQPITP
jgi:poly-gamma-glutamate synthesis protein (capsule biosynthesis protein)